MKNNQIFEGDIAIIGGGITGVAIARELSKYKAETILIEKSKNLSEGQSKESQGCIYTGLNMAGSLLLKTSLLPAGAKLADYYDPNRPLIKWSEQGFSEWTHVLKELDVKHQYLPLLILAKGKEQIEDLNKIRDLGKAIGGKYAEFEQVIREQILTFEPNVSKDIDTGLYAKDCVIGIYPPDAVIALAENAAKNGVMVMMNAEVTGITKNSEYHVVETPRGQIKVRFVVNASGRYGDKIADMGGSRDWNLNFVKTQLVILDERLKGIVNSMIRRPNKPGIMRTIVPREKTIWLQCSAYEKTFREDTAVSREAINKSIELASEMVPAISEKYILGAYNGVRVLNTRNPEENLIEFPPDNPRFLNAIIRMPGFTGALPMSRYVVKILADAGLELVSKPRFDLHREKISN